MNASTENTGNGPSRRRRRTFADNQRAVRMAHARKQANRPPWTLEGFLARCAAANGKAPPQEPVVVRAEPTSSVPTRARTTPATATGPTDWHCHHHRHGGHGENNYRGDRTCYGGCGTPAPWIK